jgi:curved DNA-binding protein CbpA
MNTKEARHLLGVTEETDQAGIDKAFRKASLIHHPDKGGTHERQARLQEAHQTLVAELIKKQAGGVITIPDFNDPDVIERCRRYENQALHGDDLNRIVYETMRAFPGVAWPSVWPPAEDPVLTLVAVSGGAVTSGVQEAAPKQEKKGKRKRDNLESYNNPGKKADEVVGNKKRRGRPPKSKKCDEEATKTHKRPRGAAPKDQYGSRKQWNEVTGEWREAEEAI